MKNFTSNAPFPTGAQIRIGVLGKVPVDVQLAVGRIPVGLGNKAIGIARTRFLCLISPNTPVIFFKITWVNRLSAGVIHEASR